MVFPFNQEYTGDDVIKQMQQTLEWKTPEQALVEITVMIAEIPPEKWHDVSGHVLSSEERDSAWRTMLWAEKFLSDPANGYITSKEKYDLCKNVADGIINGEIDRRNWEYDPKKGE